MSSDHVTVAQLIEQLRAYPPDMLVAISQPLNEGEEYEGIINGPRHLEVVQVQDVRSGFNPIDFQGGAWTGGNNDDGSDWPVLLIAPWKDAPRHWRRGDDQEDRG